MKICISCNCQKNLSDFYKRKDSKDGYRNECKECKVKKEKSRYFENVELSREKSKLYYKNKLEKGPNYHKEYYSKNKDRLNVHNKASYERHKEKRIEAACNWAKLNRGKSNANKKSYKLAKARACLTWVQEDEDLLWMMQEAYSLAELRKNLFGFDWHVDHIVPLRGKTVSGLHVPWNLQVIPAKENISKSNKFIGV